MEALEDAGLLGSPDRRLEGLDGLSADLVEDIEADEILETATADQAETWE